MINFSLMNGFGDWIVTAIGNIIGTLFEWVMDIFVFLFYWVFCLIGNLADMIQALFRAFSGLGKTTALSEGVFTDDVYMIFQSPQIRNVLISMGVLALLLLIITTAIAVVKTEFVGFGEKGGNSKSKVIGTSLKALGNIIIVPLCCILAVVGVNAVLRAIDSITSGGSNTTLSRQVFVAAAHDANLLRNGKDKVAYANAINVGINTYGLDFDDYASAAGAAGLEGPEKYAAVIDYLFLNNVPVKNTNNLNTEYASGWIINFSSKSYKTATSFDYTNASMVKLYYNFGDFNILVALLAVFVVAFNLLTMLLTIIKRIFELTILFVISPPIVAISPIDGGNALKQWRTSFVASLLSIFGPIVAINMIFIILPLVNRIDVISAVPALATWGTAVEGIRNLAEVLIICAAVSYIKDLSGMFSKIIGSNNAADTDAAVKGFGKNVKTAASMGKTMGAAGAAPLKALGSATAAGFKKRASGGSVGASFGAAFKGMGDSMLKSTDKVINKAAGVVNETTGSKIEAKAVGSDAVDKFMGKMHKLNEGYHTFRAANSANFGHEAKRDQHWESAKQGKRNAEGYENEVKLRHAKSAEEAAQLKAKLKGTKAEAFHDPQEEHKDHKNKTGADLVTERNKAEKEETKNKTDLSTLQKDYDTHMAAYNAAGTPADKAAELSALRDLAEAIRELKERTKKD